VNKAGFLSIIFNPTLMNFNLMALKFMLKEMLGASSLLQAYRLAQSQMIFQLRTGYSHKTQSK